MSIRLKQRAGMLLVAGAALLAVALAILPGVAEAQEQVATVPTTTVAEGADVVGPTNASADASAPAAGPPPSRPGLLRSDGQAHSIPQPSRPASEPAADEPAVAAAPAPLERAAPVPASKPVALPDLPVIEATPVARISVEPSSPESLTFRRQLLGLGTLALSFAVAIIMVRKLPLKRDSGASLGARRRLDELQRLLAKHQTSAGVPPGEPATARSAGATAKEVGRGSRRPYEVRVAKGFAGGR